MKYAAVINVQSGEGYFLEEDRQRELREIFSGGGHELDLQVVEGDGLEAAFERVLKTEAETIIVGGGDGTIASGADFLAGTGRAMGILPLGTFNLEARALEISLDPFMAAKELLTAEAIDVDLLRVNGRPCLCATILGFYPALAKARESFHGQSWWRKSVRVSYEVLWLMGRSPVLRLQIETPEGGKSFRTRLAAFSPGPYRDSWGLMPDRGDLATGKMTAYLGNHSSRMSILRVGMKFISGTLFSTEEMESFEVGELTVSGGRRRSLSVMIDGETLELDLPLRLKIEPGALRVLYPGEAPK